MPNPSLVAQTSAADQLHDALGEAIRRGTYSEGSRLPGERVLATQLGASRTTLRKALDELEADGLVFRSPQRGWFVGQLMVGEPPNTLESYSEMAHSRGMVARSRVITSTVRLPSFDEAAGLRLQPFDQVLELHRIRLLDKIPTCLDVSVIALARAPGIDQVDLTDRSLYEELETTCHVSIYRSAYKVRAVPATLEVADALAIAPGAPVLVGHETTYDRDGRPIILGAVTYRGDAYSFEADLYRRIEG